jgi:predicted MFS family arabinose efflux permease
VSSQAAWRNVAACLCTVTIGLGLARFAYTPLIPALIAAHWFAPAQAVYLGAANLVGYLAGALTAQFFARRLGVRAALRVFLVLATASLLACAHEGGFAWFLPWRLVSGFAGAGLVVLAAPSVLPLLPEKHRGLAGGVIFLGVGIGVVISGTVIPMLLKLGVAWAWLGLASAAFGLSVFAWFNLPADQPGTIGASPRRLGTSGALWALYAAYGLGAIGQVPALLFMADFVARGLGDGVSAGSNVWAVFGLGALAGPLGAGMLADRVGFVSTLRGLYLSQILAFAGLIFWPALPVVAVANFLLGAGVPALVVLVLGRSQFLSRNDAHARRRAWSLATTGYASGQALGAYGFSYAYATIGRYDLLFGVAAVFMAFGFIAGEVSRGQEERKSSADGTDRR